MAAEPEVVWMPGGVRTEIQLSGADTGGAFCLLVDEPPAGWSLPSHIHTDAAETIHVVAGEFQMTVGGATERIGPDRRSISRRGSSTRAGTSATRSRRRSATAGSSSTKPAFRPPRRW